MDDSKKNIELLSQSIAYNRKEFESNVNKATEIQQQNYQNFSNMFESSHASYSNHLTAMGVILALSGAAFIFSLRAYKNREIQQLKDETLSEVTAAITKKGVVKNLVEVSLTESKIIDILDTRLNTIANGLEQQIINRIKDKELYQQNNGNSGPALSDIIK
ncbi:hypothetical protein [Shewanella sp. GXUN23E]|uniref:hypothetical protein n=1 Tax=Shewanella sp. GXUN23E TaxID=3422498 RepID=UPI003D7D16F2